MLKQAEHRLGTPSESLSQSAAISAVGSDDPAQAAGHLQWMEQTYGDVYNAYGDFPNPALDPTGTVDGCYYNYCDNGIETNDPVGINNLGIEFTMKLYFKENFNARTDPELNLQATKRKYNENNWLASAQSILLR